MNHGEFTAVMIVAIVMFASIIRAKYGYGRHRRRDGGEIPPSDQGETLRLRDEVKELKERLKVLERITVEKENSLAKEIESLRDR
ncbi:hypothetical protein [Sphingomonas sp.]|jgi:hypothetical protein|uniref:hypothetical protein n=1 Tax=Sphingomonas sp. TaxID=28214 RepID=UPI0038ABF40C